MRLFLTRGWAVDELRSDAAPGQGCRRFPESGQGRFVARNVERPRPAICHSESALRYHAGDEIIVEVEATDGEFEKRMPFLGLDIWSENPRRRLRRAHTYGAVIQNRDRGATTRQLARYGTTDDSCANHDDIRPRGHRS